jgi:hypothetical protein
MAALITLEAPAEFGDLKPARIAAVKKFIHRNNRNQDLDVDAVVAYSFLPAAPSTTSSTMKTCP